MLCPVPYLTTRRLELRQFTPADADILLELNSDPAVMHFLTGGKPLGREEIERELVGWLRYYEQSRGFGVWAAVERSSGTFIGGFALEPGEQAGGPAGSAELGYRLHRSAWGKGYGTEGSRALIAKAFTELGIDRVFAQTMAVNTASRRVMEKAGLVYVRTWHESWPDPIDGSEHGEVEYALDRAAWLVAMGSEVSFDG
jgi:RimJ/RimL family protein N-acetyltransferase